MAVASLAGPDGWTPQRARGPLLAASGLTWTTWRRAVASLVAAGLVEELTGAPASRGTVASSSSYRLTAAGEEAGRSGPLRPARGPLVARSGGVGGALALALVPSALREKEPEQEHPEERAGGPLGGPLAARSGSVTDDGLRYLADAIREGCAALAQASRPSLLVGAARSRPDPRGWTASDCVVLCPEDPTHGNTVPKVNGLDGSHFGRCSVQGCPGRYDPAVAQRQAHAPPRRPMPSSSDPRVSSAASARLEREAQERREDLARTRAQLEADDVEERVARIREARERVAKLIGRPSARGPGPTRSWP